MTRETLQRLEFAPIRDAYPDRWERGDPLAAEINVPFSGRMLVRRQGADDRHEVALVEMGGDPYGTCDCDGFHYNDGPCSHLVAAWRAQGRDRDRNIVPTMPAQQVVVDLEDPAAQRGREAAERDRERATATDGGYPR